jgi:Carboxypeptidase regulatory-like domain
VRSKNTSAVLSLLFATSTSPVRATTCIPGKKFKVPQVCGIVTDKHGIAVPDAKIELVPTDRPRETAEISSDQQGRFTFSNAPNGDYEIRIDSRHFWTASQLFTVSRSQQAQKCSQPIHVVMAPVVGPVAGCSYVENAWKKSEFK